MKHHNFFINQKYNICVIFLLSIWSFFSFHNWISDSEFWPVTLSGHFEQWREHPALIYKGLFHLSLSWIYLLDLNTVQHLLVAKAFYSFLGVLYFILFYQIARKHLDEFLSLLVLILVLSSSLGFSQIGVIRSDFLASLFVLIYIYFSSKERSWKHQSYLYFVLCAALLLTTPKSIYWILAIGVGLLIQWKPAQRMELLRFASGIIILALGLITLIDQKYLQSQIFQSLYLAWQHHISLNGSSVRMNDLEFLYPYLKNDFPLILFSLFLFIKAFFDDTKNYVIIGQVLVLGFFVLVHKPLLPFFVGSLFVVVLVFLLPILKSFSRKHITVLFIFVGLVQLIASHSRLYYFPNDIQIKTIQIVSQLINSKSYSVIDGLGLFPREKNLELTYMGPFDPVANEIFLQKIKIKKPDFLVYTGRFLNIEPEISRFLANHYRNVGNGYWLRSDIQDDVKLENILAGFHFNYQPDQSILY